MQEVTQHLRLLFILNIKVVCVFIQSNTAEKNKMLIITCIMTIIIPTGHFPFYRTSATHWAFSILQNFCRSSDQNSTDPYHYCHSWSVVLKFCSSTSQNGMNNASWNKRTITMHINHHFHILLFLFLVLPGMPGHLTADKRGAPSLAAAYGSAASLVNPPSINPSVHPAPTHSLVRSHTSNLPLQQVHY